jgi:hypothetical protein
VVASQCIVPAVAVAYGLTSDWIGPRATSLVTAGRRWAPAEAPGLELGAPIVDRAAMMLLDRILPDYHFREVHSVAVSATGAHVFAALKSGNAWRATSVPASDEDSFVACSGKRPAKTFGTSR